MGLINSTYEHKLAHAYHKIDMRGLLIHEGRRAQLEQEINDDITKHCSDISGIFNFPVGLGVSREPNYLNLRAPQKVLERLKNLGYKVPRIRKKNQETQEMESKESVCELAMQQLLANPLLWPTPTGGDAIKLMLKVSELNTIRIRYINARLYNSVYYSIYNVAGTVTGRRGSKKHIFNLGGNSQNFPKHSELGRRFRRCIIARPGRIFFMVDQVSAEDWPVQALSENYTALEEMRQGVNRHYKFASLIFSHPIDWLKEQREVLKNPDADLMYYLGKKGRHAHNYGMRPKRLSEALAAEGHTVPISTCELILQKIDQADPNVERVYHEYIKEQLFATKTLRTPLGRERQFFGLRANDKNYEILNEAYSYIPQSIVGDNTGLAILFLDSCNCYVVQEGHDSIAQEVPFKESELLRVYKDTKAAFTRTIKFHNGIEIEIPIEGELGFDFENTIKIKPFTEEGVIAAYNKLKQQEAISNATKTDETVAGVLS